MSGNKDTEDTK